mmetsp:Transcript_21406/g.70917  ORF Transcript_21406/g.70917 Transcript_21406/m.70917 type:complete len:203 (-) Transcript_21406:384-992(-)
MQLSSIRAHERLRGGHEARMPWARGGKGVPEKGKDVRRKRKEHRRTGSTGGVKGAADRRKYRRRGRSRRKGDHGARLLPVERDKSTEHEGSNILHASSHDSDQPRHEWDVAEVLEARSVAGNQVGEEFTLNILNHVRMALNPITYFHCHRSSGAAKSQQAMGTDHADHVGSWGVVDKLVVSRRKVGTLETSSQSFWSNDVDR